MVDVGLGHSGYSGQTTLGHLAAADSLTEVLDEPLMQITKSHGVSPRADSYEK
jgi:hypothetical protein